MGPFTACKAHDIKNVRYEGPEAEDHDYKGRIEHPPALFPVQPLHPTGVFKKPVPGKEDEARDNGSCQRSEREVEHGVRHFAASFRVYWPLFWHNGRNTSRCTRTQKTWQRDNKH